MVVDEHGKPVEEKKVHKFGHFDIPPDAYLGLRAGLNAEKEYPYVPNMYALVGKEDVKAR